MKVYLIKTPEYDKQEFDSVVDMVKSFTGDIEFVASTYVFDKTISPFLNKFNPDYKFPKVSSKEQTELLNIW